MELPNQFWCIILSLCLIAKLSSCQDLLIKNTTKGQVRGRYQYSRANRKFASFEGIRFAKPPVRFEPPVEPDAWSELYDATKPGYQCPHFLPMTGTYFDESEDCLSLNVFVPAELESYKNLTVMFWIHGGGYMFGSGSVMGPKYIMDEDVVLVTTNYRLGAFGFLNSEDGLVRGNMGFKDMILSLKWVQDNINFFGGDPTKVTIFGESAGAAAVHSLMYSPAAKGLFSKVIAQSGSALAPWNTVNKPSETFLSLSEKLKCTGMNNSQLVKCLREKSIRDILEAHTDYPFSTTLDPNPNDGDYSVFPEPFQTLIETGNNSKNLPLIIGRNDVEWLGTAKASLNDTQYVNRLNTNWTKAIMEKVDFTKFVHADDSFDRISEDIRTFYFSGRQIITNNAENIESLEQMMSDFMFVWGVKNSAILNTKYGGKVYPYIFMYRGTFSLADDINFPEEGRKRPTHADDLQYLFQSLQVPSKNWPDLQSGSDDENFSTQLISLWASFAKNSEPDPNVLGAVWKPVPENTTVLDSELEWYIINSTAVSQLESTRLRDRVKFWNTIFISSPALSVSGSFIVISFASVVWSVLA